MNLLFHYTKPQVLDTIRKVLFKFNQPVENDVYLETWIVENFPNYDDRIAFRRLLQKLDAFQFHHYCSDWLKEFAIAYDEYREVAKDENNEPIYENFIRLTPFGTHFFKTLFLTYVNPNLC